MTEEEEINLGYKFKMTDWRGYVRSRLETQDKALGRLDSKMDKVLDNARSHITRQELEQAITMHSESCAKTARRNNPVSTDQWKILGAAIAAIGILAGIVGQLLDWLRIAITGG